MTAGTHACKRTGARVGVSWRNASAGKTHLKEALHQMVKYEPRCEKTGLWGF